jgi:hypothetical protein
MVGKEYIPCPVQLSSRLHRPPAPVASSSKEKTFSQSRLFSPAFTGTEGRRSRMLEEVDRLYRAKERSASKVSNVEIRGFGLTS